MAVDHLEGGVLHEELLSSLLQLFSNVVNIISAYMT